MGSRDKWARRALDGFKQVKELGKRGGADGGVGYVVEPSDKRTKLRGSGLKPGSELPGWLLIRREERQIEGWGVIIMRITARIRRW